MFEILRKDWRLLMRERRTFVLLLAIPVLLITIIGLTTGHLLEGLRIQHLQLVVASQDPGPLSERLIEQLAGIDRVEIDQAPTPEAAKARIDRFEGMGAMIIGTRFSQLVEAVGLIDILDLPNRKLSEGLYSLDIEIYTRPGRHISQAAIHQFVFTQSLDRLVVPYVLDRLPFVKDYLEEYQRKRPRIDTGEERLGTDPFFAGLLPSSHTIYQTLVPGFAVMFAFFVIVLMARSFLAERVSGTLLRMQVAPVHDASLVVGKTLPFLIISVLQGTILFLAGRFLFGMSWGHSPWMLVPVIFCTSLAATGLGLLTAMLSRTDAQVGAYSVLFVVALAGIGGCFLPSHWMPWVLRQMSLATPHAWALRAYDQILASERPDPATVGLSCAILLGFAIFFLGLSLWRFRNLRP